MNNQVIQMDLIDQMVKDQKVRISITKESHWYFFHFYLGHYVKYPTAPFQKEIIMLTEDDTVRNLFVVAFRGSGKSTIITTSYPIWAILGKQQKKFVLIICQTKIQAKQNMMNLRRELESNTLLRNDLGPFQEENDEWGSSSIVFSNTGARIMVASTEQSIRGIRHNEHRPDLIICDDVEDIASTKTREGRDKTYKWLKGEIIPAGDRNTKLVIIGNLLHEDSLLMRLKDDIRDEKIDGVIKEYPIVKNGKILWPGKYPNMEEVEKDKKQVGDEVSWQREYLLRIIATDDQVIDPSIIKYYDRLPPTNHYAYRGIYASVDLAISQKDSADYTAIVSAMVFGRRDKLRVYILPNPIVKKINFPNQVILLKEYSNTILKRSDDRLFVEGIGYQEALPQMLETMGINATAVKPTVDKRTRLALTVPMIQSGMVLFPQKGAEEIIRQIVGFGVEKHDDIADAFSMLLSQINNIHGNENTWLISFLGGSTLYCRDYADVEKDKDGKFGMIECE